MNINYLRNFYVSRVTYLTTPRSAPAFMRKVAVMEIRVSKQQRETRVKLSQWERDFFINNNCKVATEKDIAACSHAQLLRNKLKYAKAILSKLRS